MGDQAVVGLGSLVLQVVAARSLGASGLGRFATLVSLLVLLTALQVGWVGEARTVLGAADARLRGAVASFQLATAVLAVVVAVSVAELSSLTSGGETAIFGLLAFLWVLEDTGRRWFMARLDFRALVVNDVVYLGVTLGAAAALRAVLGSATLAQLLGAMALGAAAALVAAVVSLPASERQAGPVTAWGLRTVAAFGVWRSAQAALRPLAASALRLIIVGVTSAAALGRLEMARVLVAPVLTVTGGLGAFLLPHYARRAGAGTVAAREVVLPAVGLAVLSAAWAAAAVAFGPALAPVLSNGTVEVDRWAVVGWSLFATASAAGVPIGTALVAQRRSALVFRARAADAAVGLGLALALAMAASATYAPYGLACGAVVGALLLWSPAVHGAGTTRPSPA